MTTTLFSASLSPTAATPSNISNSGSTATSSSSMPDSLQDFAIPRRKKSLPPNSSTSLLVPSDAATCRRLSTGPEEEDEHRRSSETNANMKTSKANNFDSDHYQHNRDTFHSKTIKKSNDNEDHLLYRNRPRSREEQQGLSLNSVSATRGEGYHRYQHQEEEVGSTAASTTSKSSSSTFIDAIGRDERRSIVDSVNSSGSTGSGGFRRLKKFSPGSKGIQSPSTSSAAESPTSTASSPPIVHTTSVNEPSGVSGGAMSPNKQSRTMGQDEIDAMEEQLAAANSFQQTQMRLWKMAQEQNRVMQEAQEQKRMRKLKKKQEREKQKKIRRNSVSTDDGDVNATLNIAKSDKEPHRPIFSSNESLMDEQEERKAKRKLKKKKKKLHRLADEAEELKTISSAISPSSPSDNASTSSSSAFSSTKTNKNRRLVKMESFRRTMSDDNDGPARKKAKAVKTESTPKDDIKYERNIASKKKLSSVAEKYKAATPSFPTLTMALADTVKTRVRSCNKKDKDELELLQAASFETKKRRKKNKQIREKLSSPEVESSGIKKKKKKRVSDGVAEEVDVKRKRGRPPKHKNGGLLTDTVYDADAEAPEVVKRRRGRPPKNKVKVVSSDDAPSEISSSSATVHAGVAKDKKRLKNQAIPGNATKSNSISERQQSLHPLPFKKRMAAAAAAEAPLSWEKHGASSTTASKVSISTAGTGPGASPEFGTEASSLSEVTHPLGLMLPPSASGVFQKTCASVPREILSNSAIAPSQLSSFDINTSINTSSITVGPGISSDDSDGDDDSDSSSDSDTDDEELFNFANRMFGTSAKPLPKESNAASTAEPTDLSPEMCEMERRRQKQEEARALTTKEINAILKEETSNGGGVSASWVRRSVRQPSRSLLNAPLTRTLLDKLRGNDMEMVVLKMKKYVSDPDAPPMVIDAALDALEECTNCESLYIQNFNKGMRDKQVLHLLKILQMPTCNIWCLNIGETYNVTEDTWETFAEGLKKTKITHMYASEHTITSELKDEIRETIRLNRRKHNMHNDPNNLDVIVQCTHCWWNPINAKVLRPYLRKRGFESLLQDKEAQGVRGTQSEAPTA